MFESCMYDLIFSNTLQEFDRLSSEARQPRVEHQRHQWDDSIHVWPEINTYKSLIKHDA